MKNKITKIMGVVFALVLISSMMAFALPTSAAPYTPLVPLGNMWTGFTTTPGFFGSYFYDPAITKVGPIAEAINGDLFAYVRNATAPGPYTDELFKSTDGGRTWFYSTALLCYHGDAIVEIVCSKVSEDVFYVTDGNYVYKSLDGGMNFMIVAENSLETMLLGQCGDLVHITNNPILCMDVAYDANGNSLIFIGVAYTYAANPLNADPSVLYINEGGYPSEWIDLQLHCFRNADAPGANDTNPDYFPCP